MNSIFIYIIILLITINLSDLVTSFPASHLTVKKNNTTRIIVDKIEKCPSVTTRTIPTNVKDLRPDDIKVVMGLGDSVMAGFGVRINFFVDAFKNGNNPFIEFRGSNFATGGDSGVISVPNLMKRYNPKLIGDSIGNHSIEVCFGFFCPGGFHPEQDQLSGAQSGAQVSNAVRQVDYIIDQLSKRKDIDIKNDWKLTTVWFGNNDLCNGCTEESQKLLFSPDQMENHLRDALEKLRTNVPKVFVNLLSLFKISQMYKLNLKDKSCILRRALGLWVECSCAFLIGDVGDQARKKMDDLADQYNKVFKKVANDYQQKNYNDFIVAYDPGLENMDISNGDLNLISGVDCFHPSLISHERLSIAIWNNLLKPSSLKSNKYDPTVEQRINCLNDNDRLST